jgi:hypothetical protein
MQHQYDDVVEMLDLVNRSFPHITDPDIWYKTSQGLELVAPYVNAAGPDCHAAYIAATQRLQRGSGDLIDPRNGEKLDI